MGYCRLLLVACLCGVACAQEPVHSGEMPHWMLESPALWLAAAEDALIALREDGVVTRLDDSGMTVLARDFRGPFIQICGGRVLGVDSGGNLAWTDGGRGPRVSVDAKPLCLEDGHIVAVAPGGVGVLLLSSDLEPLHPAQIDTLPDAQPALTVGALGFGDGQDAVALLSNPTTRYRHGILGDSVEAASVSLLSLPRLKLLAHYDLPEPFVFEQLRVLPATLSGEAALLATRSSRRGGAGVVMLSRRGESLTLTAEAPEIGAPGRWLNLFAASRDAAYAVKTSHIQGILQRYQFDDSRLELSERSGGVTNHVIGSRNLDLSVLLTSGEEGDLLALPSQDLRELRLFRCAETCTLEASYDLSARLSSNLVVTTWRGEAVLGAADSSGTVWLWPFEDDQPR